MLTNFVNKQLWCFYKQTHSAQTTKIKNKEDIQQEGGNGSSLFQKQFSEENVYLAYDSISVRVYNGKVGTDCKNWQAWSKITFSTTNRKQKEYPECVPRL